MQMIMSDVFNDESLMPFGKYKGQKMANVPAKYLLWLSDQEWIKKYPKVFDYIEDNADVLEMELNK